MIPIDNCVLFGNTFVFSNIISDWSIVVKLFLIDKLLITFSVLTSSAKGLTNSPFTFESSSIEILSAKIPRSNVVLYDAYVPFSYFLNS